MVFVDFDKENINIQDVHQNISNPARSSAFFMYTVFFLEIKSSWRNIGFSVENVVENMDHTSCFAFGLSIHLTFSTVFSTLNPIFLHDDLISRKKRYT